MKMRLRMWLREMAGAERDFRILSNRIDMELAERDRDVLARLRATENSLRLIEHRLRMIEKLNLGDGNGELGEAAARRLLAEERANADRLDASAAKLRGQTIDEYRADRERRLEAKRRAAEVEKQRDTGLKSEILSGDH